MWGRFRIAGLIELRGQPARNSFSIGSLRDHWRLFTTEDSRRNGSHDDPIPPTCLLDELVLARGGGRIANRLKSLASVELLILDDWGIQPLDAQARHDLLEILEDLHGGKSTIVIIQLPTVSWHHATGDSTYADAILDRFQRCFDRDYE